MDIIEHEQRAAGPVTFGTGQGELNRSVADPATPAAGPETDETVFSVLATRARTRASAHLWLTAGIGAIDAVALTVARPSLWWLAAACVSVSAYAVWGLADRALARSGGAPRRAWTPLLLNLIRGSAIALGVAAGAATAIGFLGAALGRGALGW